MPCFHMILQYLKTEELYMIITECLTINHHFNDIIIICIVQTVREMYTYNFVGPTPTLYMYALGEEEINSLLNSCISLKVL